MIISSLIRTSLQVVGKRQYHLSSACYKFSFAVAPKAPTLNKADREDTAREASVVTNAGQASAESFYIPRCPPPRGSVESPAPYDNLEKHVLDIVEHGMSTASATRLVKENMRVVKNMLYVRDRRYHLYRNVHVVAFGKAVLGMTRAVDEMLGDHILRGIAILPTGTLKRARSVERDLELQHAAHHSFESPAKPHARFLLRSNSRIRVFEGARNNLPDEEAMQASSEVKRLACSLNEHDILIVLVTGGGSALLTLPVEGISLDEMKMASHLLNMHGANVYDINAVLTQISQLTGGKLAELASPAKVIAFLLSDVVGDAFEYIASGPTMIDTSASASHALDIVRLYKLQNLMPKRVMEYLHQKASQEMSAAEVGIFKMSKSSIGTLRHAQPEPSVQGGAERGGGEDARAVLNTVNRMAEAREARLNIMQYNVQNIVIGNNRIALEGAARHAQNEFGYVSHVLSSRIGGSVENAAELFSKLCLFLQCWYELQLESGHIVGSESPDFDLPHPIPSSNVPGDVFFSRINHVYQSSNHDVRRHLRQRDTGAAVHHSATCEKFLRSLAHQRIKKQSLQDEENDHQHASSCAVSICNSTSEMALALSQAEFDLVRCGVKKEQLNELLRVAKLAFILRRPLCILSGGELTVNFTDDSGTHQRRASIGRGGRCMHLSLLMARRLHELRRSSEDKLFGKASLAFQFCAVGTDGQDGPTPGAGAYVNSHTLLGASSPDRDEQTVLQECDEAIRNFDSYNWLKQHADGRYLLRYAYTDSNVMDLYALLVTRNE